MELFSIRIQRTFQLVSTAKVLDCLVFAARRPPLGAWLVKRKSSSLRCGIFFCQALRKKAIQGPEAYKIGKTYPDGIIHS